MADGDDVIEELLGKGLAQAARQMLDGRDFDGAAKTLKELLELLPGDPMLGTLLASALLAGDRDKEGKEQLDSVIRKHPDFPMAHYYNGVYFSGKAQWDEAAAAYRKAIGLYPPHAKEAIADAWQNLGCALWEAGEKPEALEAWKTCLKVAPGNKLAKKNLRECTSGYGLPRSISTAMDDSHAFTDMKMKQYLAEKGKESFDSLDEANAALQRITDAWNGQIAAKYGRRLDDLSVKEKIRIFEAVKVDFEFAAGRAGPKSRRPGKGGPKKGWVKKGGQGTGGPKDG
jgi:tetratricopeptide (TPR) repeat protein